MPYTYNEDGIQQRLCDLCGGSVRGHGFADDGLVVKHLSAWVCASFRSGLPIVRPKEEAKDEGKPRTKQQKRQQKEYAMSRVYTCLDCGTECTGMGRLCADCAADRNREKAREGVRRQRARTIRLGTYRCADCNAALGDRYATRCRDCERVRRIGLPRAERALTVPAGHKL